MNYTGLLLLCVCWMFAIAVALWILALLNGDEE